MFSKYLYILFFILLLSCKKEKIEYDINPKLEFISITPDPVDEYQPLLIIFKYTDGDGDLGENNSTAKNLFVTDNRIGITYSYRIKQLAPDNEQLPITGNLEAKIENAVITNNALSQTVNFSLYIVDRAGHSSNILTTTEVTIKK